MLGSGPPSLKSGQDYLYGIDLVRFACATAVAVYHLTYHERQTATFMPFGWVGVEIFFVISGLVIANSARGASARQFAIGRFLRLYPTAWCAALVSYPFFLMGQARAGHGLLPLLGSLTLLRKPFLATAYWTLPIELAFYLVVFLMLLFHRIERIQSLAILLILWSTPWSIALMLNAKGIVHWDWLAVGYGAVNMWLYRYGTYFGLGILIWLFKEKRITTAGIVAAAWALLLAPMETYARAVQLQPPFPPSTGIIESLWKDTTVSANAGFFFGLAAIMLSVRFNRLFPANAAVRKTVRSLGLMTFPFYLLHQNLGDETVRWSDKAHLPPLVGAAAAIVFVAAISYLIAAFGEPALRRVLRRRVPMLSAPPEARIAVPS